MKKILLLAVATALALTANAYDFMVNGIAYYRFYDVYDDGIQAIVTYENTTSPRYSNLSGSISIPSSVTYDGYTYKVIAIGDHAFQGCSSLTSVTIPNSVKSIGNGAFSDCSSLSSVTIPNTVTSIGSSAFSYCSGLTSVTIPDLVTSIGEGTFEGCRSLASVTIPNSVASIGNSAFSGCSGLTSVTIPNLVTSIGNSTFSGCSGLTSVTIPNSVTSIGIYAFSGCSGLTSVTIPNSVTTIGREAFSNCTGLTSVTIPRSVTSISDYAFKGCSGLTEVRWNAVNCDAEYFSPFNYLTNIKSFIFGNEVENIPRRLCYGLSGLTSVTIPNSVTSIGDYAFFCCTGLTSVTIPNSVTSISYGAFWGCTSLTSATIGNSVTSISDWAFYDCSGLTSVTIPNSVTSIGNGAFCNCSGLTSIEIPNSVTSIGSDAFSGCRGLNGELTIPNSVMTIGSGAFASCTGVISIVVESGNANYDSRNNCNAIIETESNTLILGCKNTIIPNSVTRIGDYAFFCCTGLTSVTIPNSVTSIGEHAFSNCSSLTSMIIPNSVTSIGENAFYNCIGLTDIYCLIVNPIAINSNVFYNYNANLFVCPNSVNKYQTASPWNQFNVLSDNIHFVTSISLDQQTNVLTIGETFTLIANILPENAYDKSVTWSSSDETVASVDTQGVVTALKPGTATITATTKDGSNLSASCVVTVAQPVTGISLNHNTYTLKYNGQDVYSFKLTTTTTPSNAYNTAVVWSSSNNGVATVASDGTVTSTGKGIATITATTTDGSNLSDSCIVTVEQLATEITLEPQAKTLNVGESFVLLPTVLPENANDKSVTWSSNSPTVASVDSLGNVTALKRGTATITATTKDGSNLNASCVVAVLQPVTGISLNENSHTLLYNDQETYSFTLTATTLPNNANNHVVQWASSDENIATVTDDGEVTSTGLGTAVITATTTDGSNLSDSCVVTVEPVLATQISIDKIKEVLTIGNTLQVTGTVDDAATIKNFNWTSSNDAVASVDANGLVRGVGAGTASITATTIDGSNLSASCIIQVLYPSETAGAGDVNEDGRIDITDATLIVSYLQGNYPMSVLDEALMDVNGDGDINMSDVLRVISLIRNDN